MMMRFLLPSAFAALIVAIILLVWGIRKKAPAPLCISILLLLALFAGYHILLYFITSM